MAAVREDMIVWQSGKSKDTIVQQSSQKAYLLGACHTARSDVMCVLYELAEYPPFGWVPSLSIERVCFKC